MSVERQKRDAVIRLLVAHVGAQAAHVGSLGPDAGPRQRHLVVQHYKALVEEVWDDAPDAHVMTINEVASAAGKVPVGHGR